METKQLPDITPSEIRCLLAIQKCINKKPYLKPSHQEVAVALKRTQQAASKTISNLVDKEYALFTPDQKRSLELTDRAYRLLSEIRKTQ